MHRLLLEAGSLSFFHHLLTCTFRLSGFSVRGGQHAGIVSGTEQLTAGKWNVWIFNLALIFNSAVLFSCSSIRSDLWDSYWASRRWGLRGHVAEGAGRWGTHWDLGSQRGGRGAISVGQRLTSVWLQSPSAPWPHLTCKAGAGSAGAEIKCGSERLVLSPWYTRGNVKCVPVSPPPHYGDLLPAHRQQQTMLWLD